MKEIIVFDAETNEVLDINDQLPGEWVPFEGDTYDGKPVFLQQIDEPFSYLTAKEKAMEYAAGDFIAIAGSMDSGFVVWPVEAAELEKSDGRVAAANRYMAL